MGGYISPVGVCLFGLILYLCIEYGRLPVYISKGYNVPDRMINQAKDKGQLHLDKF